MLGTEHFYHYSSDIWSMQTGDSDNNLHSEFLAEQSSVKHE